MANDFSGDDNCKAVWTFDSSLTTDSKGTNTLEEHNTPGTGTGQDGTDCVDLEYSNSECLHISDADLDSGFPLKSGESNDDISVTLWYKKESNNGFAGIFTKWDTGAGARSFYIRDHAGTLNFYIGTGTGATFELLSSKTGMSIETWYHVGATFNNTTKAWKLRVWDDTAGSVILDESDTASNNIAITNAPIGIGSSFNGGSQDRHFDGLIDEVVVFNGIITTRDIDAIRSGTFPPSQNEFSGDSYCEALWNLDPGALTTDSIGTNTLTDNNTVGSSSDAKQGSGCADFEYDNTEWLSIADANLDSSFPLKSGGSGTFSVTFWFKRESSKNFAGLVTKNENTTANSKCFLIRNHGGAIEFYIGTDTGDNYELVDNTFSGVSSGVWFHVGLTFNNTTKAWKLRIWNDTSSTVVYDGSGTSTKNMSLTTAPVGIGAAHTSGASWNPYDGLIDEVVVFADVLTTGEIDQIRQGTYVIAAEGWSHKWNSLTIDKIDGQTPIKINGI